MFHGFGWIVVRTTPMIRMAKEDFREVRSLSRLVSHITKPLLAGIANALGPINSCPGPEKSSARECPRTAFSGAPAVSTPGF
jgi:hypothetical protein